jgi:hypothetical protein
MARFSHRRGSRLLTTMNLLGAVAVAFTLVVNLARGYPLIAIAGTVLVAGVLYNAGCMPAARAGSKPSSAKRRPTRDTVPARHRQDRMRLRGRPGTVSTDNGGRPRPAQGPFGVTDAEPRCA